MLERREQVVQMAGRGLLPGAFDDMERRFLLARGNKLGAPFPIAPVEQENARACLQPQDIDQIVRLSRLQRHGYPFGQRSLDEQPRGTEIVAGIARFIRGRKGVPAHPPKAVQRFSVRFAALWPEFPQI